MTNPFAPPPSLPVVPASPDPIAIVASSQEQVDAYLTAGRPPGAWVPVFGVEDVPKRIGGMAILIEEGVPDDLQRALLEALGVSGGEAEA